MLDRSGDRPRIGGARDKVAAIEIIAEDRNAAHSRYLILVRTSPVLVTILGQQSRGTAPSNAKKLVRIFRDAERRCNVLEISLQATVGAQCNDAVPQSKDIWWRVDRR